MQKNIFFYIFAYVKHFSKIMAKENIAPIVRRIIPSIKSFVSTYKPKFSSACHYPMVFDDEEWYDEWGYNSAWWKEYYGNQDVEDDLDDDYEMDIYLYLDIDNTTHGGKNECDEHFTSIDSLKEYCKMNGINLKLSELDIIRNNSVGHCCLDPESQTKGELVLMCDRSYGSLLWRCCSDDSVLW